MLAVEAIETGCDEKRRVVLDELKDALDEGEVLVRRLGARYEDRFKDALARRELRQWVGGCQGVDVDPVNVTLLAEGAIEDERVNRVTSPVLRLKKPNTVVETGEFGWLAVLCMAPLITALRGIGRAERVPEVPILLVQEIHQSVGTGDGPCS